MFEAVIALCASLAEGPCRDHLLPGYEGDIAALCTAALQARPPDLTVFAPLDAQGPPRCAPVGPALEVTEVAPGVFVHMGAIAEPDPANRGDVGNLGFVIGESSVAVIDTGTARWMGEALWRAIRAETDKPVSHTLITHMHPDHALGASPFAEAGAQIVGHANLSRAVSDRQANYLESLSLIVGPEAMLGTRAVAVDWPVEMTAEIDLGGRVLQLRAWPMAHTGTDLTVLDVTTGTFFAGDLIFDLHTPALDGRLRGWRAVLAELGTQAFQQVVPGHGGPVVAWPGGLEPMQRYLSVLEADTRAAIDAGQRLGEAVEEIAAEEAAHWQLFEAYNPRNATVAFTELEWD
ncbi:quinoprotein relay system zinc metallohydrolase 2 [Roseobacter sinensis]|uniref:Quinoprotein relay system zinc metallohydrolase 2 n=1 Tax=Roseobacter sinensis TaxID=2931391 RepID=A0ABT3BKG9_9RHOB|nr:quinoprotein relay system zinc metallohydrolase 2 [Roseobacter sp. WL0113]MCV3274065.1 quinoprotein relay system zinc metallohydrolase 2 [Roseobacter sp. WL0113]